MSINRPVRRRWYWKTEDGYTPVRLSEFRNTSIMKLLKGSYCLIDGKYVRCIDIADHQQRDDIYREFENAIRILKQ